MWRLVHRKLQLSGARGCWVQELGAGLPGEDELVVVLPGPVGGQVGVVGGRGVGHRPGGKVLVMVLLVVLLMLVLVMLVVWASVWHSVWSTWCT